MAAEERVAEERVAAHRRRALLLGWTRPTVPGQTGTTGTTETLPRDNGHNGDAKRTPIGPMDPSVCQNVQNFEANSAVATKIGEDKNKEEIV